MATALELHQQALEKIVDTIQHRREGYLRDFILQSDLEYTQHQQGVLDAYDEVQVLLDSVKYELDQMLDHHTGIARPLDWQKVGS